MNIDDYGFTLKPQNNKHRALRGLVVCSYFLCGRRNNCTCRCCPQHGCTLHKNCQKCGHDKNDHSVDRGMDMNDAKHMECVKCGCYMVVPKPVKKTTHAGLCDWCHKKCTLPCCWADMGTLGTGMFHKGCVGKYTSSNLYKRLQQQKKSGRMF